MLSHSTSRPTSVTIEPDGPDACIVTAGADDPERMVFYFALPGCDFEVLEPPEVQQAVRVVAERLRASRHAVISSRSVRTRNAAAYGLSAVPART